MGNKRPPTDIEAPTGTILSHRLERIAALQAGVDSEGGAAARGPDRWLKALETKTRERLAPLQERFDLPSQAEIRALARRITALEQKLEPPAEAKPRRRLVRKRK